MADRSALRRCAVLAVGTITAGVGLGLGTAAAQAADVDLEASMHATADYPSAHGHAEYDNDSEGREFDLSLTGLKPLAGHRVVVRVHGHVVAKPRVGSRGRVHLERHSGVPRMSAGNVVRVRTRSGTLVSRGSLVLDHDD